ncbi:MAG: universal stress protein [Kofleriaceae bacterium]|nr:universal stress protein [Kofleriaceae bacterium]MCL4224896.1 universal stress protein [Myxococcales bacterium]
MTGSDPSEWRDETQADGDGLPEEGTDPGASSGPRAIVVALDFSPPAQRALAWALDHAVAGDELHLVHVVERRWRLADLRPGAGEVTRELAEVEALAAAELRRHAEAARGRVPRIHEHVAVGRPADELVRLAGELGAHAVVIGSHGHDAVSRLFVGSVAERVVRAAPCTVVVVKP